jgi:organic hydroperoxide reductase OsmC/OhrA
MKRQHDYSATIKWTGNNGKGTSNYNNFERDHSISNNNKPDILCSADPAFLGDKTKYNPEELLLASLSSCHMLWYLHLCSESNIVVTKYYDNATGIMIEKTDGSGCFSKVTLNPTIIVTENLMIEKAIELHKKANELCFIANSVNFKIFHKPNCSV